MNKILKPCPFCGGEARIVGHEILGLYVENAFLNQKHLIQRKKPLQHGTSECRKTQKAKRGDKCINQSGIISAIFVKPEKRFLCAACAALKKTVSTQIVNES